MNKTSLSSRQAIKRFFDPVFSIRQWRKVSCWPTLFVLFDVYIIFMFKRVWEVIESKEYQILSEYLIEFILILLLFYGIKLVIKDRRWPDTMFKLQRYLRKKYLTQYIASDNSFMEKTWTWRLINIIKEGINNQVKWLEQVSYQLPDLIIKIIVALYFVASLWRKYWVWFLVCVIWMQVVVIYINNFALEARRYRKEIKILWSKFFVRFLWSKFEIIQSNKAQDEIQYSDGLYWRLWKVNKKVNRYLRWMYNIPLFISHTLTLIVLYYAYVSGKDWTFSLGIFNGLIATIWYFSQLLVNSTRTFKEVSKNFIHIEKLWELFDTAPQDTRFTTGEVFNLKNGSIKLDHIDFNYETKSRQEKEDVNNNNTKVFDRFSLSITWWTKTALVWPSWSWKSTLVKLIAWYISPDAWSISVDDQSLEDLALWTYYTHVWYLTQEPSVFDGTVRENLLYATTDTVDEQTLTTAIKNAQCDFIYNFADGLDTEIGERWIRLSWGQRQRLAIAKIFLKNPKIIILDEPTAALDSESEEAITQAMNLLFKDRTVIIIAHRLQTVKHADRIILIEQGKIVEEWTHTQLMEQKGKYWKMVELQSGF